MGRASKRESAEIRRTALAHRREGRMDEALSLYAHAVAAAPDDPVALLHLAACQAELGKRREALETLERIIARHPSSSAPKKLREYLLRH